MSLVVSQFSIGRTLSGTRIDVARTKDDEDVWAIRCGGLCWTRDRGWEAEPMPSSRTDEFLARARFTEKEACALAIALAAGHPGAALPSNET